MKVNCKKDIEDIAKEGYIVEIINKFLVIRGIPYLNANGEFKVSSIAIKLEYATETKLNPPKDHVILYSGEYPYDENQKKIKGFKAEYNRDKNIDRGIKINHSLSMMFHNNKGSGYKSYFHQAMMYISKISKPSEKKYPKKSANEKRKNIEEMEKRGGEIIDTIRTKTPLKYHYEFTNRMGINTASEKLIGQKIAIIGVGGTGSYILDFVSKTPVEEIHLYDADKFEIVNIPRFPGSPKEDEINSNTEKVNYLYNQYKTIHEGIKPHPQNLEKETQLGDINFAFICVDKGPEREKIIEILENKKIPYIDTGIELKKTKEVSLTGFVRTTQIDPQTGNTARGKVNFQEKGKDDYSENIQIGEINALNAAIAVIEWKKTMRFYKSRKKNEKVIYALHSNEIFKQ